MTENEQALKLRQIASLPANQVQGWYDAATMERQPFPGEVSALHDRAVLLRIRINTAPERQPAWLRA